MSLRKDPTSKFVTTLGVYQWDGEKYVLQKREGYWYKGPWSLAMDTAPVYVAEDYRWYQDDGAIGSRTAIKAENTAITNTDGIGAGSVVGLRVNVGETNTAAGTGLHTGGWTLQFSKNGGAFTTVGAATDVRYYDSTNLTNGNFIAAANYVLSWSGSEVQRDWGDECEDGVSDASNEWSNDYCEIEYSIQFADTNSVNDAFTFRVLGPDGSTAVTFTNVPTATLGPVNTTIPVDIGAIVTTPPLTPVRLVNDIRSPAYYGMRVYSVVGLTLDGITPTIEVTAVGGGNHTVQPGVGTLQFGQNLAPSAEIDHIRQMGNQPGSIVIGQNLAPERIVNFIRAPPSGELLLGQNLQPSAEITHTRQMGVGSLLLQGLTPARIVNHIVTPDAGAIVTTPALAPSAEISVIRQMGAGQLLFGQNLAPDLLENSIRTPDAGTLQFGQNLAPSAEITHNRAIAQEDILLIQGLAPTRLVGNNVQPDVGAIVTTPALAPSAEIDHIRQMGAGQLLTDPLTPTRLVNDIRSPDADALLLGQNLAPSAEIDHVRAIQQEDLLVIQGLAPDPLVNHIQAIQQEDLLVLNGLTPQAQNSGDAPSVQPDAGSLALNGLAPTVGITVAVGVGTLVTDETLTVSVHETHSPGAGAAIFSGLAPSAEIDHNRATGLGSAVFAGYAPTIDVGGGNSVAQPGQDSLVLAGNAVAINVANSGTAIVNPTATVGYTDNTVYCQRTNFRIKSKDLVEEWNGRRVRDDSYDPKHPQLGVTSRSDAQRGSVRPEQEDRFIGEDVPEVEAGDL